MITHSALEVDCPKCFMPAGVLCKDGTGRKTERRHAARIAAAHAARVRAAKEKGDEKEKEGKNG